MPLVYSGGALEKQPVGQAVIRPEFREKLLFAARGNAGGTLDHHQYVYTGNTGTGSSEPPTIVNAAADSADGKAWNTTSAYISGRNVTGVDRPLVETSASQDWTFQFVVHNVQQTGTNPGFWRTDASQAGTSFCIANGANRRPWVRVNGTDVIKAASGEQWTLGQKLNILVRFKNSSRVEVWWDGVLKHSATHSVAANSWTTTGSIFAFGSQSLAERIQGAVTAIRFWQAYLPDEQMTRLASDEWSFYAPRRIWVPVTAGSGASAALTGASAGTAAGTVTPSITAALTGVAASVAAGSVSAGSDVTTALTGTSATATAGTLSAATATSAALTGVSSTSAAGTLAASISAALTGVSSTAAAGTLSAGGDASAAVTGQAASTAQGTVGVTVSGSAALSGASAAASVGTVAPAISTALSGASAAAAVGSLTAANSNVSVTITGQALSTAQGTVSASVSGAATVALTGAAAVVMAGNIIVIAPSVGWTPVDDSVPNMWVPVDDSNAALWT